MYKEDLDIVVHESIRRLLRNDIELLREGL